jgi:hypothetical protein
VQQFVALLELDELDCWCHEDGAACRTTNETLNMLRDFFGERLISKRIWPPRSRDITLSILFSMGHLKEIAYKDNPRTQNDLKKAISQAINDITPTMVRGLSGSVRNRVQLCLQENGGHFQHLL